MHISPLIELQPETKGYKYKRFVRLKEDPKPQKEKVSLKDEHQPNRIISHTQGLKINKKINFHELLSIPLEKQIQKENSTKQNQTFFLKFQSPETKKNNKKQTIHLIKNNKKYTLSKDKKTEISSQKGQRTKQNNLQKQQSSELKQASKTMYFKPLGNLSKHSVSSHFNPKGLQPDRTHHINHDNSLEVIKYSYKDRLLMLLQIRKQQRNQRKFQKAKSSFSQYGNKTHRQFYSQSKMDDILKEKNEQSNSPYGAKDKWEYKDRYYLRTKRKLLRSKINGDQKTNNEPSPWQQGEFFEQF